MQSAPLCSGEDLWSVAVRTGLVRLRLLDSHGAGFSAIQAAAEATKGKAGNSALCDVFIVAGIGFSSVSDAGHAFGENHVLDVPCRKCVLLPFRNYACLNFQG